MEVMEQVTAVAVVLLLLLGTLWWMRRRGWAVSSLARRGPARRRIECVERLSLSPQHSLHLVWLGDTELLVAASPGGCSLLHSGPRQHAGVAE